MSGKRLRVKKACLECRRRKRGCDQKLPCGPCSHSGLECLYDASLASHHARRDFAHSLSETSQLVALQDARYNDAIGGAPRCTDIHVIDTQSGAGIIAEDQPRFVKRTSAIAFPRLLGLALKAEHPPKLHSYAYNLGLRPEEHSIDYGMLMVSADTVKDYSEVFFNVPIDLVDRSWFNEKLEAYYNHPQPNLGTVLGGVFAVGSCLSPGHSKEQDVVAWCKACLEDSSVARRPSIEIIVGFALRVWYLRMTTRPNCAWLASCTLVHQMEAVGLHREENIKRLSQFSSLSDRSLRSLFWNAWALHKITSLEYGRTHIELVITTHRPGSKFVDMASAPSLELLDDIQVTDDFLIFTKADVALYIFRCLWETKLDINTKILFKIGQDALDSAERLCLDHSKTLFFNTVGSVFQFTCALMALRTPEALKLLAKSMRVLDMIAKRVNTIMTRDALATANSLLGSVIQTKRGELNELDAIYMQGVPTPAPVLTDTTFDFDWALFDEEYPVIDGM